MPAQFRMSEEALQTYRELRYREDSKRQGLYIPVGFILWEDEYPGDENDMLPRGDNNTRRTVLSFHAARWHYWMDGVIPEVYADLWDEAQRQLPDWPGFQRLYVDEETKEAARNCRDAEPQIWGAFLADADEVDVVDDGDGLSRVSLTYRLDKEDNHTSWWSRIKNWFVRKASSRTK